MKDDVEKRANLQSASDESPSSARIPVPENMKKFVSDTT